MRKLPFMLIIDNLSKSYGEYLVFKGLNHRFSAGCIAMCDEENTGKSSLLDIIAGVIVPDSGDVWINGHSINRTPQQAKSQIAYIPDNCMAYPKLTGREFLEQVAIEKNTVLNSYALSLSRDLGLDPHLDKRFEQMSTGTRRKVFIVAASLGEPAVVIADGPSDGLDARARVVLAELFKEWSKDRVVLFASHDAELVQACEASVFSLSS